jgi:hypothetical protein
MYPKHFDPLPDINSFSLERRTETCLRPHVNRLSATPHRGLGLASGLLPSWTSNQMYSALLVTVSLFQQLYLYEIGHNI